MQVLIAPRRPGHHLLEVSSMSEPGPPTAEKPVTRAASDETSLRLDYRARVLVVEDEHELRELIARWLETRRYQVAEAADGKDAIDLLQAGFDADVILLDLAMPRLDGRTFLEWLRASPEHRHRRVIVASGYLDERPVDADRTFQKPFRPDLLERELARLAEED
jgi:CheY-like chemotaxis protein